MLDFLANDAFYAAEPGAQPPFVLLHAMPVDARMWGRVMALAPTTPMVAFHAPGFGASSAGEEVARAYGDGQPSLAAYARAILDRLDFWGVDRFVLGGMSMGGAVAGAIASIAPSRLAGLALMDTRITADDVSGKERRIQAVALCEEGRVYESVKAWTTTMLSSQASDKLRSQMDAEFRTVPSLALAWLQRAMANRTDTSAALGALTCPVVLIRGEDDPTCTRESFEDLQKINPAARIEQIPAAGHFTAHEQPEILAELLEEFYSLAVFSSKA